MFHRSMACRMHHTAVDMNLRVPNLARPITHPDILTRLWRSLVRLLGWKEDPPPERVEEQQYAAGEMVPATKTG